MDVICKYSKPIEKPLYESRVKICLRVALIVAALAVTIFAVVTGALPVALSILCFGGLGLASLYCIQKALDEKGEKMHMIKELVLATIIPAAVVFCLHAAFARHQIDVDKMPMPPMTAGSFGDFFIP